ncbi:glycine zipper 2TM domain-containing protein [Microbaculum sp. FT89]|uniref:glycine zipper 2TM domain-containing protein n=1 Tax=Microbaculum sp. FT89 TaxID=3447298 RepID=UPI003F52BD99
MHLTKFVAIAALGLSVAACNGDRGGETLGTVVGATAGGIIGNQFGSGGGRALATVAGVAVGGLIGNRIGASVDEDARRRAMEAEYQALQYGPPNTPVVWREPDQDVYGEVVPGAPYQRGGSDCRDYTHTIYVNGQPEVGRGTACRMPDGTWQTVS